MKYRSNLLLLLLVALSLVGCAKKAVYIDESFSIDSPFKLRVDGDTALACESARRSLLGQGYLIELANSDEVKGRKATRGENTFIEMNIVCVPENNGSTIFATGVLSTYDLKKNSSSASVGLSALGSISLPIGQSIDSLVKVSEETIDDTGFYQRFFTAVSAVLVAMDAGKAPEEPVEVPVEEPAAIEPAPSPAQSAIWPELFPEQPQPSDAPALFPAQAVEPEIVPEPVSVQAEPVYTPEPTPAPLSPVNDPEPTPEAESLAAPMGTIPDDEPLGIPAAAVPEEEPMGIPPQSLPIEQAPGSSASELSPIHTDAEKKIAPVTGVPKALDAETEATPISEIEGLF